LLFYPCWSRWAVSFASCRYQTAEDEGIAFFFKASQKPAYLLLSSAFVLGILFAMPMYFYLPVLASFLFLLFSFSQVQYRLGGQTEQTFGFTAVVAEQTFLLCAAISGVLFRYIGG
jgi:cobalamin synthase